MTILAFDKLDAEISKKLVSLLQTCQKEDGVAIKMYWEILSEPHNFPANYLFYEKDQLVGYLSAFLFEDNEAEICAMTHPAHRCNGIFNSLYQVAQNEMMHIGVGHFIVSHPSTSKSAHECLKSLSAHYCYSEFQMLASRPKIALDFPSALTLRPITPSSENLEQLAKLDVDCFDSNYEAILDRFSHLSQQKNRSAWFLCLNETPIGKIHARFKDAIAYFHDLCILPNYQSQGYGKMMLKKAMQAAMEQGFQHFALDVHAAQKHALKLYESCGFQTLRIDEYWRLD